MKQKKIYDFSFGRVRDRVVSVFKKDKRDYSPVDLAAKTGLPPYQVNAVLPAVVDEFNGRMKVTETGEMLYSFPNGFQSKYRGLAALTRNGAYRLGQLLATVGKWIFKAWIMVMLVGYAVLFLAVLIVMVLGSFALSASGKDNNSNRRGGFGGVIIATRLLDLVFRLVFYSSLVRHERRRRFERPSGPKRPFHRAVFSFVFGEEYSKQQEAEDMKRAMVAFVQEHKGVVTQEEIMAGFGLSPDEADSELSRLMLEYEGEPKVTDEGTLYFWFPEIRRVQTRAAASGWTWPLRESNGNEKKVNATILGINAFNLVFSGIFTTALLGPGSVGHSLSLQLGLLGREYLAIAPATTMNVTFWVLGLVPFIYSVLFFTIPAVRRMRERKENRTRQRRRFMQDVYRALWKNPEEVSPRHLSRTPGGRQLGDPEMVAQQALTRLDVVPDVAQVGESGTIYTFPEIARKRKGVEAIRENLSAREERGETVFDSHEPL